MDYIKSLMTAGESKVFFLFNQRLQSEFLDKLMVLITKIGSAGFSIGFCVLLLLFGGSGLRLTAVESSLALTLTFIIAQILKNQIARPRPFLVLTNIRTLGRLWDDYSFPSGHTTAAASVLFIIAINYPLLTPILLLLAALVACSRVYLGVHYPLDAAAGFVLGMTGALFTHSLLVLL